jgi:hypothetical protein
MSEPMKHSPKAWPMGILVGLVAVAYPAVGGLVAPLQAGSVFMKNGYIIQGTVVDRDDVSIVLGWPNGKVSIAHRFVESIVLEAGEEQSLKELEDARRLVSTAEAPEEDESLAEVNETEELPSSLEAFIKTYNVGSGLLVEPAPLEPGLSEGPLLTAEGDPVEPGSEGGDPVEVTPIPGGAASLADAIHDEERGITLRPPRGWEKREVEDLLQFAGPPDASGFRPSLSVVALPAGALGASEYVALVKDEQARLLAGHVLLEEGERTFGTEKAYELVARGSYEGRAAVLRQCVVLSGGQVWLLSAFTADADLEGPFGLVEEVLKTVELAAE